MARPPISGTRWLSLSGRELLVLAVGVGIALLAVGTTQVVDWISRTGQVTVSEESDVLPMPTRLNINTATEYELTMLPRIGPKTADAIIEYRGKHGPFASLEELANVSRIGPKIIEGIRPHAMCAPVEAAERPAEE